MRRGWGQGCEILLNGDVFFRFILYLLHKQKKDTNAHTDEICNVRIVCFTEVFEMSLRLD